MKIAAAALAALVACSASSWAQVPGTSIGTTQGSTRDAGSAGGNVTSEEAARTAPSAGSSAARAPQPSIMDTRDPAASGGHSIDPCQALSGAEKDRCAARNAPSGTASGVGGSPDRVGPGSTGMGR